MFKFTKARAAPLPRVINKAKPSKTATLKKLNAFLKAEEPQTVEWLVNFWDKQASAVSYKELREAYLMGGLTPAQIAKWQKNYANLVNTALAPQWYKAIEAAALEVKAQYPYFLYEPVIAAAQDYIKQHGAELVTALVGEQEAALRAMIAQASGYGAVTADELSRIMRPVIGLTVPQSAANLNYYTAVKTGFLNAGLDGTEAEHKAREAAAKYAAQQHRYRAMNIARTELAKAYNEGAYLATKDAQAQGYIGDCRKVWLTAANERVCKICVSLDGQPRGMDDNFSVGVKAPPAHPSCRCGVAYEEIGDGVKISDNSLTNAPESDIIEPQTFDNTQATPEADPPEPVQYDRYKSSKAVPKTYAEQLNGFTDEEKAAMTHYTGYSYKDINRYLRGTESYASAQTKQAITRLDRAFGRVESELSHSVTLFRGTHPANFTEWKRLENMPLDKWAGQTISDRAFVSTSIVEGSNFGAKPGEFAMTINAPQGSKGILVSPISNYKNEDEVLLKRGTNFRIDRVKKSSDGVFNIEVTILNQTDADGNINPLF